MEKSKIIEAIHFPGETIQHIQSFLSGKEAARSSILSKSWYAAWLTRPNLNFSEDDFPTYSDKTRFMNFVTKTIQRYVELNLNIQDFKVLIHHGYLSDNISLWTRKAIKLGAADIDIKNQSGQYFRFLLPCEVLESESLVRLSLEGGRIDHQKVISCSRLKSLVLSGMWVRNNIIWDIISTCPLIEEFVLRNCINIDDRTFVLPVNNFHKLKILSLECVQIGEWFFRDMSSRFPCLKELALHFCCTSHGEIQICSNSLECISISFNCLSLFRAKFDVPRIRKFKLSSFCVPSVSFKTTSMEWESDISLMCTVNSSWFVELRESLLELSSSKINLNLKIRVSLDEGGYEYAEHMIGIPKPPTVEKLCLLMDAPISVQSTLLQDLFWSCRPKLMTLDLSSTYVKNYDVVMLICNTMIPIEGECEKGNTGALHDLEEVNVEVCGHIAWTWRRHVPSKKLDASAFSECIEAQANFRASLRSLLSSTSYRASLRSLSRSTRTTLDHSAIYGWIDGKKICLHLRWG